MKKVKLILLTGLMTLGLGQTLVACDSTKATAQDEKEVKQDSPVKAIDAKFMREKIWDYKSEPTKFVFKGTRPVVIDFYADWCPPCRALGPRLAEVAKEYQGKVDVYKVNVDNERELANAFGIKSLPTLIYIPVQGTPSNSIGLLSVDQLKESFEKIIK